MDEFKEYARQVVDQGRQLLKGRKFQISRPGVGAVDFEFEISRDYEIDCRKSDSLISPVVGEIEVKRRVVYDELLGRKGVRRRMAHHRYRMWISGRNVEDE